MRLREQSAFDLRLKVQSDSHGLAALFHTTTLDSFYCPMNPTEPRAKASGPAFKNHPSGLTFAVKIITATSKLGPLAYSASTGLRQTRARTTTRKRS